MARAARRKRTRCTRSSRAGWRPSGEEGGGRRRPGVIALMHAAGRRAGLSSAQRSARGAGGAHHALEEVVCDVHGAEGVALYVGLHLLRSPASQVGNANGAQPGTSAVAEGAAQLCVGPGAHRGRPGRTAALHSARRRSELNARNPERARRSCSPPRPNPYCLPGVEEARQDVARVAEDDLGYWWGHATGMSS